VAASIVHTEVHIVNSLDNDTSTIFQSGETSDLSSLANWAQTYVIATKDTTGVPVVTLTLGEEKDGITTVM
jgi:hypothetical protein